MKQLLIPVLLFVLLGCASRIYGLPEEVWHAMSAEERQQHMLQRQELSLSREVRAKTEAELELARLQQNHKQESESRTESEPKAEETSESDGSQEAKLNDYLWVLVAGGTMIIANERQSFMPFEVLLKPEEILRTRVQALQGLDYAELELVFNQGRLSIEPRQAAYFLSEQEQWLDGRSYWLSTGVGLQWQQVGVQIQWLQLSAEEYSSWQDQQQASWQQQRLERESQARIAAQAEARRLALEAERLAKELEESKKQEQKQKDNDDSSQSVAQEARVEVKLNSGFARFGQHNRPFRPLSISLKPGQSEQVVLVALTGEAIRVTLNWTGQQLFIVDAGQTTQFTPNFASGQSFMQRFDAPWVAGLHQVELVMQLQP